MKKNVLLLLSLCVLTISCGGKNEKKEEAKTESVEVADCGCGDLYQGKLMGKLFTGTCADKDQNDTIILTKKYKNGYIIYEKEKEKINGKYIVTLDMNYDDNKEYNGYRIRMEDGSIKSYCEMKDGKFFNYYTAYISGGYDDYKGFITVMWQNKNGIDVGGDSMNNVYPDESRPKCMPDAEKPENYGTYQGWTLKELDKDVFDNVIADLRKEMPKFMHKE
jgi:hypothetical protein